MSEHEPHDEPDLLRTIRLNKLNALKEMGQDPFTIERFDRTHSPADIVHETAPHWSLSDEERESTLIRAAGRITAARTKGKVTFADIRDETGRVQLYVRRDDLGDAAFETFNDLDLSDIIGVEGFPFRTRTGEPSLHVKSYTLLAKALRPVPFGKQDDSGNIYGALTDREERYRHRYLDLLANPEARAMLTKRCRVVSAMRRFLDGHGFLEVRCLGCDLHQTIALGIIRRPKDTPVHELERYMRCKDCSKVRGYAYTRSCLVALRQTKISAADPPAIWWPGER